jgi:hypothetical protein
MISLDPRPTQRNYSTINAHLKISLGVGIITTSLPVAWFTFHWHFVVGLVVTLIYGAAALTVGTAYIGLGMSPVVKRFARSRRARELEVIPRARLLPPQE